MGVYLDNLIAPTSIPLFERLSLTVFFELTFTLVKLTEFICRAKEFACVVAESFLKKVCASVYAGSYEK